MLSHRHFESPPESCQAPRETAASSLPCCKALSFHDNTFPHKHTNSLRFYLQDEKLEKVWVFFQFWISEQVISPVKLLTLVWGEEGGFVPKTSHSESDDALPLSLHMASLSEGLSLNMQPWLVYVINMLVYAKRWKNAPALMMLVGTQYFFRFLPLPDAWN